MLDDDVWSSVVGIVLALLASMASATGLSLIKYAYLVMDAQDAIETADDPGKGDDEPWPSSGATMAGAGTGDTDVVIVTDIGDSGGGTGSTPVAGGGDRDPASHTRDPADGDAGAPGWSEPTVAAMTRVSAPTALTHAVPSDSWRRHAASRSPDTGGDGPAPATRHNDSARSKTTGGVKPAVLPLSSATSSWKTAAGAGDGGADGAAPSTPAAGAAARPATPAPLPVVMVNGRPLPSLDCGACCGRRRCCSRTFSADFALLMGNLLITFVSSAFDIAALLFAPVELLGPLNGATLLLNVYIAPLIVRERVYTIDWAATGLCVPGMVLSSVFGPHSNPTITTEIVEAGFARAAMWQFELCALGTFALVMLSVRLLDAPWARHWIQTQAGAAVHADAASEGTSPRSRGGSSPTPPPGPPQTGTTPTPASASQASRSGPVTSTAVTAAATAAASAAAVQVPVAADTSAATSAPAGAHPPRLSRRSCIVASLLRSQAVLYALAAAILGGQQTLVSKLAIELADTTFSGGQPEQFLRPVTWLCIVGAALAAVVQLMILNRGLQHGDALLVVPIYQSLLLLLVTLTSSMFFGAFVNMESSRVAGFVIGVGLSFTGVMLLTQRPVPPLRPQEGGERRRKRKTPWVVVWGAVSIIVVVVMTAGTLIVLASGT